MTEVSAPQPISDTTAETASFDVLADLVRARRTHMLVDHDREVPASLVTRLCELACCAPNHKRTNPWRFALLSGEARARLGEAFVADMIDAEFGDEQKRTKTLTKYLRTPATLVVGSTPHENPMLHVENRDAVAAGVQNLLLGATALGLATFWSSPPLPASGRVLELCRFEPDVTITGIVYLGWQRETVAPHDRPPATVHLVDG